MLPEDSLVFASCSLSRGTVTQPFVIGRPRVQSQVCLLYLHRRLAQRTNFVWTGIRPKNTRFLKKQNQKPVAHAQRPGVLTLAPRPHSQTWQMWCGAGTSQRAKVRFQMRSGKSLVKTQNPSRVTITGARFFHLLQLIHIRWITWITFACISFFSSEMLL